MRWWFVLVVGVVGCERPKSSQGEPTSPPPKTNATSISLPAPDASAAHQAAPEAGAVRDAGRAPGSLSERFDDETVGAPPAAFETVVGDWSIAQAGGGTGLQVDGSRWRGGTPSANLADQAKRLYGDRYAEFLDGVKAFAFYPLAIKREPPPTGDLRLSVRFYPIAGKIDQAAGLAFGVAPDGSYLGIRANALEDNILFFRIVKGKRTIIDTIRSVPTPTRTWHTLVVELRGKHVAVRLDDVPRFDKALDSAPIGHVGLWSKADSHVLFDDFEITPL